MPTLLKTSTVNQHWHLVYLSEDQKVMITSEDKGHTHSINIYKDPLTNEPRLSIGISGTNPHTHEPEDLKNPLDLNPQKRPDTEVLSEAINLFLHAADIEQASRTKAYESWLFFKGKQWDDQEITELNAKHRAAQVYNYVQAFVDVLSGLGRQNRLDPRAFPIEGSDEGVSDVVTAALVWIAKRNKMSAQEIRVLEDAIITGRGLFHIDISQKRNPMGDIILERFPWADGYFGEHQELDASDATHAHKAKWLSLQEAQARYPHLKSELETQLASSDTYPEDSSGVQDKLRKLQLYENIIDKAHQRLRLIEHEIKETRQAYFVMSADGSFKQEVDFQAYQKADTIPGLVLADFPMDRIRIVLTVGTLLIKNYYSDRPYEGFSLTPLYIYKYDDNDFAGKIEAMKDPQREINKRGSQAIDIVNRMLAKGWFYDEDTFPSEQDLNQFRKDSSKPGFTAKVSDTARPPVQPETTQFPNELFSMHRQNVDILQSVTNIPPAMVGGGTGYESGDALGIQRSSGLIGNERVFDNFIYAKQVVFQKVFAMVPTVYGPERLARLILSAASDPNRTENLQIGNREVPPRRTSMEDMELTQAIIQMLSTKDLLEYDIAIGEQPMSATARESQFKLWISAAQQGFPVPPELLVELSPLPNKGKWGRMMAAQQQAQQEMERQKTQAELAKAGRIPVNNNGGNQ